uniref:Uncharacterized protein n=1 Tax=Opuntia streptacantha TaxID=393608 RepID=A0A7C9A584_OPUST
MIIEPIFFTTTLNLESSSDSRIASSIRLKIYVTNTIFMDSKQPVYGMGFPRLINLLHSSLILLKISQHHPLGDTPKHATQPCKTHMTQNLLHNRNTAHSQGSASVV